MWMWFDKKEWKNNHVSCASLSFGFAHSVDDQAFKSENILIYSNVMAHKSIDAVNFPFHFRHFHFRRLIFSMVRMQFVVNAEHVTNNLPAIIFFSLSLARSCVFGDFVKFILWLFSVSVVCVE